MPKINKQNISSQNKDWILTLPRKNKKNFLFFC